MTPDQAADFALQIIREVKAKMILTGLGEPQEIQRACEEIYHRLGCKIPRDMIIDAFAAA